LREGGFLAGPLELESRKRIFECVRSNPGLHFREIQRRTGLSIGVLDYNLDYMVRRGLVTVTKREGFSRYFPGGGIGADKQRILSCLRQEIPRGIVLYLLRHPGATHGEPLENFTISGGTLSYHVKKLVSKGVVKAERRGRESHLTVLDPDKVADLLIVYRRTFLDTLVDEFVSYYFERGLAHDTAPEPSEDGRPQSDKDEE